MRVLHVIPSLSAKDGGPSVALPLMERALKGRGVEVTVATTVDGSSSARSGSPTAVPVEVEGTVRYYFRRQTDYYKYSSDLSRWLDREVTKFDVVHVHALFSHASVTGALAARRKSVPYIIRPLGVLNEYGMTAKRALLKRISFHFIERPLLEHASAVHFTSPQERTEAERLGICLRAVVLPIGIDLARFEHLPEAAEFLSAWPRASTRRLVLFLSRLDPKKGLEVLLDGFVAVRRQAPEAMLVVAGGGDARYVEGLKARAARLGIDQDILWTGHLDERSKLGALGAASAFVLPSLSENFGIAAVEALAAGIPSVLSIGVGISEEVLRAGAGMIVQNDPGAVADALVRILGDEGLSRALAVSARALARERYSLEAMGKGLIDLYTGIVEVRRDAGGRSI